MQILTDLYIIQNKKDIFNSFTTVMSSSIIPLDNFHRIITFLGDFIIVIFLRLNFMSNDSVCQKATVHYLCICESHCA